MTKEDYVSLEVAKLLKEKGFNEECGSAYDKDGNIGVYRISLNWNEVYSWAFSRPTLYEAVKWLRNEHDINVTVATAIPAWFDRVPNDNGTLYMPLIAYKKRGRQSKMAILRNLTDSNYEKVCNDAILEALKLI